MRDIRQPGATGGAAFEKQAAPYVAYRVRQLESFPVVVQPRQGNAGSSFSRSLNDEKAGRLVRVERRFKPTSHLHPLVAELA